MTYLVVLALAGAAALLALGVLYASSLSAAYHRARAAALAAYAWVRSLPARVAAAARDAIARL